MKKGEKLRLLRENKKLTREALGNEINYSPQMIYKIEVGEKEPSLKFLNTVIKYFEVPVSFFIDEVFDELFNDIRSKDLEDIIINKADLEYRGKILSREEREFILDSINKSLELYYKHININK
ncbi:helix-turn-helix domain-containing protein [Clostridium magnum]|uniref:Helix-turn-helix domain protein n=1 Tax=Clostridium magnum DSM 2767 TaxID=1121326 RepID=A0A161XDB9_9CLOT|nr:helix-turn-helix transcriptional regulator [Clostridium magnum]KZL92336.1 helix-turn-helix domain protein [Clostridium magnum DSM 2767]SHH12967.1 DNA-binding transcriptional regulator, XRE-family HTH domain [Clostridium magnum DSM 2767]